MCTKKKTMSSGAGAYLSYFLDVFGYLSMLLNHSDVVELVRSTMSWGFTSILMRQEAALPMMSRFSVGKTSLSVSARWESPWSSH